MFFGGLLCQQYWIDQWIKVEEMNLRWKRFHQTKLKSEKYKKLADAVKENTEREAGKYIILPSTHAGSPRNILEKFNDAMAVVTRFGKPDLFITFTCNPNWSEITENLKINQQPWMRHDIISRVFHLKLN